MVVALTKGTLKLSSKPKGSISVKVATKAPKRKIWKGRDKK